MQHWDKMATTRRQDMKMFARVLLCSLVCAACATPLTTLSDGKLGYAVYCETIQERCMKTIALLSQEKNYMIVSERAQESSLPLDWVDTGAVHPKFNSRYWMEVRCDP
jgi:hypothetical protein